MTKPRDSGRYNALTLRTRLESLVEAKTNFITAYHDGVGVGTILITVPLTKAQYDRSTTGFAEASTPANLAATLAELAVRGAHGDDLQDLQDVFVSAHVDVDPAVSAGPVVDTAEDAADVLREQLFGNTADEAVEVHEAEELPPGSADRLAQHASVDPDLGAADGRVTSEGDLVYMLSSRRKAYQVVALGTHVATLSHVLDDGSVGYVTVPYGTFGFLDEVDAE